uniref:Reverse transcriptase domain-containing protein n=3 Tax=Cacopsylla melanoneura TaxID=428564 RepID=A0A8D8W759_9HEMI
MYSKEGVIQGDPLAMPLYALATLPLIKSLSCHTDTTQCWYADDSSVQGTIENLVNWWKDLNTQGPQYGYYPEGNKSCLVVSQEDIEYAQHVFEGTGIKVVTGSRFLGGYVGTNEDKNTFVVSKVDEWKSAVVKLAQVSQREPQAAYAAFVKSLQFQWTYFQRVINGVEDSFQSLNATIRSVFLPSMIGGPVGDDEADLFSLPVKKGGLAINNPMIMANLNFETSKKCSTVLVSSISNKTQLELCEHHNAMNEAKKLAKTIKNDMEDSLLQNTLQKFPPQKKRTIERSIGSVVKTKISGWLSAMPLKRDHLDMSRYEFRDALAIRYNRQPVDMPQSCDGCGEKKFDLNHALCCKTGGLVTRRHNEIRDLFGELCEKAWGNVTKEPIISEEAPGLRGDLAVRGVWEAQREALFDVRVMDTDAPSYVSRPVMSVLQSAEEEKKRKYLQACEERHATFTPLVTSVDGLFGLQMTCFVRTLVERLAERMSKPVGRLMGMIRARISVAILRASSMCLRGSRRRFKSGESLLGFEVV